MNVHRLQCSSLHKAPLTHSWKGSGWPSLKSLCKMPVLTKRTSRLPLRGGPYVLSSPQAFTEQPTSGVLTGPGWSIQSRDKTVAPPCSPSTNLMLSTQLGLGLC